MESIKQTPVQAYIKSLHNYKKIGGSIDDAIVIAETLLLELEKKENFNYFMKGVLNSESKEIEVVKVKFEELYNQNNK
jgi:hypothetical protein